MSSTARPTGTAGRRRIPVTPLTTVNPAIGSSVPATSTCPSGENASDLTVPGIFVASMNPPPISRSRSHPSTPPLLIRCPVGSSARSPM